MKFYFVCYSNNRFEQYRKNLCRQAETSFDGILEYTEEFLQGTDFYTQINPQDLYDSNLWKPYIILEALKSIDYNDVIFYLDCGDTFRNDLVTFLKIYFIHNDILLVDGAYPNEDWTKYDCFYLMFCDESKYRNVIQLENGILGFKKTEFNINLVKEWLIWCLNRKIVVKRIPSIHGKNSSNFQEHRGDQSVLTNLKVKYNLPSCDGKHIIRQIIKCNINGNYK